MSPASSHLLPPESSMFGHVGRPQHACVFRSETTEPARTVITAPMRYGFVLPGGTATEQLELGVLADQAGWDGLFIYEVAFGVDPWTTLAAIAARTTHVRLGTLLTPLPWRRPWKLAGQVVTLDQLSSGRAILTVGLGAVDTALGNTGEQLDRRV